MAAITVARAQGLTIGAVSRCTGVNIETIRYYERVGMLSAPPRSEGGHRIYGQDETRALIFIRRARELGFSLEEIRALLDLAQPAKASCADVRAIAAHHLHDVRAKIADLARLERLLARTIKQCSGKAVPECPVLDVLNANHIARASR
jgi:MerR family mercuric resistance operon transcriptional regulator